MAQRIAELEASWQALPAVALRIEAAAARSQEALAEAAEHAALREAADTRRLAVHQQVVERNEATLGDAARFLAETTDRFREGVTELGTQAVRLQAMGFAGQGRSDGASQEMLAALAEQIAAATRLGASLRITQASLAAAPPAGGTVTRLLAELEPAGLPPAIRTTLRSLGHVEEHTTRLLADIEGLARGGMALPTAVNGRAPELLRAMQDSIHRLNTAATALALASDGAACETA